MPLSVDGRAGYNVTNLCAAALAAHALGIAPGVIAGVYARFGPTWGTIPGGSCASSATGSA